MIDVLLFGIYILLHSNPFQIKFEFTFPMIVLYGIINVKTKNIFKRHPTSANIV